MIKPISEAIGVLRDQERNYRLLAESLERIAKYHPNAIFDTVKVVSPDANKDAEFVYIEREASGLVMAHPYYITIDGDPVFGESVAVGDVRPGGDVSNDCWYQIMEHRGVSEFITDSVRRYFDVQEFPKGPQS